jgi:hypothetical protein
MVNFILYTEPLSEEWSLPQDLSLPKIIRDRFSQTSFPFFRLRALMRDNTVEFSGQVNTAGEMNGFGEYTVLTGENTGDFFKGYLLNGARDGFGLYISHDGQQWEGLYQADQKHGYGIYQDKNGDKRVEWCQAGVVVSFSTGLTIAAA